MSWWNPIDQAKWVAGKFSGVGGGGDGSRAPGQKYAYNPNSKNPNVSQGTNADGSVPASPPKLSDQTGHVDPWIIDEAMRKRLLAQQGGISGQFADRGETGFGELGQQGREALAGYQRRMSGQDSVSAEQLRQGIGQLQSQQQSIAAGASPMNAASAARTAAIQSARLGSGLAGQQAIAGLQERQQAQQQYAALLQALRSQDLESALAGRRNAMTGYGAAEQGAADKTWWEKNGPAIQAGASAIAASDRRLKTSVKDGDKHARKAAEGLGAHLFRYKDEGNGKGRQFGVMAQELERAGLGHAVIDTPRGKMVHGAKLATSTAAMVGSLARRLAKLEGAAK